MKSMKYVEFKIQPDGKTADISLLHGNQPVQQNLRQQKLRSAAPVACGELQSLELQKNQRKDIDKLKDTRKTLETLYTYIYIYTDSMDSDLPPSGFSTSPSASSTISCTNAMPCKDASGRTTAKTQKTNGYPLKKTLKNNPCLCLQLDSMTLYDSMIDPFLRPRTSGDGSKARLFHWSKMDPRRMSCHQISKKNKSVIVFFLFFFLFLAFLLCISFLSHESASTTKHSRPSEP